MNNEITDADDWDSIHRFNTSAIIELKAMIQLEVHLVASAESLALINFNRHVADSQV